jgi:hypothetical protein
MFPCVKRHGETQISVSIFCGNHSQDGCWCLCFKPAMTGCLPLWVQREQASPLICLGVYPTMLIILPSCCPRVGWKCFTTRKVKWPQLFAYVCTMICFLNLSFLIPYDVEIHSSVCDIGAALRRMPALMWRLQVGARSSLYAYKEDWLLWRSRSSFIDKGTNRRFYLCQFGKTPVAQCFRRLSVVKRTAVSLATSRCMADVGVIAGLVAVMTIDAAKLVWQHCSCR